ncbi:MAG: DUF2235 domain-containing protein [Rhodobacteraceae bacterium]|nr:DUF2235 domain-containing protein [Paracoccaceae bacterium]
MKRIAIFCDGTWNRAEAEHPTNVVRLAQAVRLTAQDGVSQQVFYVMGVGTGRGSSLAARMLDRFTGGALGWGLIENIEDAYRALAFCYEPGDEIYITGFSRGAYTARSLAGLIRSCGIPPRENLARIGEAVARYRSRQAGTRPYDVESYRFRAEFAPYTVTSPEEWDWRMKHAPGMCVQLKVSYLGVWDTVGALGVPGYWAVAPLFNSGYQFHDAVLSRSVASARHAVAVDERRRTFPPALWANLGKLNRLALGLAPGDPLGGIPREHLPYREEWFAGNHGSVGGGGDLKGLSAYSFAWIAQGAQRAGLDLRPEILAEVAAEEKLSAALNNKSDPGVWARLVALRTQDREGPEAARHVSDAARARVRADKRYRPKTLAKVMAALLG